MSILLIQSVRGYAIPESSVEDHHLLVVGLGPADIESGDGEPALVQFVGNNDNSTVHDHSDHSHGGGVGGFFKRLGCDIVKGTQIVSKSVSDGKVWNSVKKGYEKVKNFFSKKELVETEKEVPVFKPTETVIVGSSTETLPEDNDSAPIDPVPDIDVRILGERETRN